MAEAVAKKYHKNVVVVGGIHIDDATKEEIDEIMAGDIAAVMGLKNTATGTSEIVCSGTISLSSSSRRGTASSKSVMAMSVEGLQYLSIRRAPSQVSV